VEKSFSHLKEEKTMPATRNLSACSLILALAVFSTSAHAAPYNYTKVVRDERGNVVHAIESGTCVRTSWIEGQDVCAPKVAYTPPQIVQQRVEVLSSDEKKVFFPFNRSELTPEARARLDTVATKLSAANSVKGASIVGYADRIGSNNYNQSLSERRAKAVQDYLAERGYVSTQIAKVRALGESAPVTQCPASLQRSDAIQCLRADRRVELELQYAATKVENKVVKPATVQPVIYDPLHQPSRAPGPHVPNAAPIGNP
jgi:outer membrane protein OmpA-like peptidoglycan-associated protein